MNHSSTIVKLAAALSKAQAEMPSAPMNSVNPFLKNRFADLGAVIAASRPVLARNGLSITQFPVSNNGSIGVTSILMHEGGEWLEETITLPLNEERGKSAAQVAGSVITYLRRYSWAAVLGMYADEDTDGHAPQQEKAAEQKAKAVERKAAEMPPETTSEMCDPLAPASIKWASAQWNNTQAQAKTAIEYQISQGHMQNPMPKAEFKRIVLGDK